MDTNISCHISLYSPPPLKYRLHIFYTPMNFLFQAVVNNIGRTIKDEDSDCFCQLKMIYYSNGSISYLSWFWRLHDGWLFGLLASLPSLSWWLWWFCCCLWGRNDWKKIKQSFCRKSFSKIILLQEWSGISSVLILWAVCHFGSFKNMPYFPPPPL